ncbi:superoxide dismutase [Streptomyces sp. NPDC003719]
MWADSETGPSGAGLPLGPSDPRQHAPPPPRAPPQPLLHHDKHHAAYVKGANDTLEQLAEARDDEQWSTVNGLEKNLAFHLSGHILHSIYWHNMSGDGGGEPLSGRLIVEQVYDHQGNVGQGSVPILVFDAWEHAFYLQYRSQRVDFIDAMWAVVDRQDVARRYDAAASRADTLLPAP